MAFPPPTVEDVAAHLSVFTRGVHGAETGTFTEETRPTRVEVERAIAATADEVDADVGDLDPSLHALAADVASVGAAAAVIVDRHADLSEALYLRFGARMKTLRRAASRRGGHGTVGTVGVRTALSRHVLEHPLVP